MKACETLDVELMVADHADQIDTKTATIVVSSTGEPVSVPAGADLAAAVANACPDDTLLLEGADYVGGVNLRDVNLRGRGAGVTFIRGTTPENDSWVVVTGGHSVTIEDVTISGGGLDGRGGGVLARTSGPTNLNDVEVRHNDGHGGVEIHSSVDTGQIRDAFVHHNQGGGIRMFCCAELAVTDSEISFNTSAEDGAGASLQEAHIIFSGNYVHDNVSEGSGGGLYLGIADGQILNNRFVGNSAEQGGGVSLRNSGALVAGNLIAENRGGGLYRSANSDSEVTVTDSTIANNDGAGVTDEVDPTFGAPMAVFNTIVTGNVVDIVGALGSSGHNLIGAPAGFVGGGNYHLAAGSPAIDAGDDSRVPLALAKDTDGDDRTLDGNGDRAARVDIGYDEAVLSRDLVPPSINAPSGVVVDATKPGGAVVTFAVTAS